MDSMTTSLLSRPADRRRQAGFTLVEVMIASTLGTIILAGVLTTFILIARSGVRVVNYSAMETQTRRAFEQLAIDARMSNGFTANFTSGVITSFTLSIPSEDLLGNRLVTYGYDTADSSDHKFFFVAGNNPTAAGRANLITNVQQLQILRYDADSNLIPAATTSSSGIKHIQVSVTIKRFGGGVMATTQVIRSSAFTLRNM